MSLYQGIFGFINSDYKSLESKLLIFSTLA
jgi:hypothetical protein